MTHRAWLGRLFLDQFAHAAVLHALWLALEHPSATASALTGAALNGFRNASLNGKPFAVAAAPADGGKAPPLSVGAETRRRRPRAWSEHGPSMFRAWSEVVRGPGLGARISESRLRVRVGVMGSLM